MNTYGHLFPNYDDGLARALEAAHRESGAAPSQPQIGAMDRRGRGTGAKTLPHQAFGKVGGVGCGGSLSFRRTPTNPFG